MVTSCVYCSVTCSISTGKSNFQEILYMLKEERARPLHIIRRDAIDGVL